MDTRQRKEVSLAQPNPFIINTWNLSHEIISDYVHESILGDASMIEPISETNKNLDKRMHAWDEILDDVLLKRL